MSVASPRSAGSQALALRDLMRKLHVAAEPSAPCVGSNHRSIAVTSGKGGVGKTNIALNLAIALAQLESRVCLIDANLGLGNVDLLCGLNGYWNLAHVVSGAREVRDILLEGPAGVAVIPGASGLADLSDCSEHAQIDVFRQLEQLGAEFDFLILDTGAGIHRTVRHFAAACDVALVVTTPEPTSIADAYATIKALAAPEGPQIEVLINQVASAEQARRITERVVETAKSFLRTRVESAGFIPHDAAVQQAVAHRRPFVVHAAKSAAAESIRRIAAHLQQSSTGQVPRTSLFAKLRETLFPATRQT